MSIKKTSTSDDHSQSAGSIAEVTTYELPVDMERPVDVPIKGAEDRTDDKFLKETPFSSEEMFSKASILAMHFLNAPRYEALLWGMKWYLQILARVVEYDEKSDNEFFQQYKALCFVSDDTDVSNWTRDDYIYHRKELASNLTNYCLRYADGMASLDAAVTNLIMLSNVNGSGKFSTIGFSCRWSYILSANNAFADFAQIKGHPEYFAHWAKFAAGTTQFGGTVISIPWFKVSIWGNLGQHCFALSDWFSSFDKDGDAPTEIDWSKPEATQLRKLADNLVDTMLNYGWDASHLVDNKPVHYSYIAQKISDEVEDSDHKNAYNIMWSDPHIENGADIALENTATGNSILLKTNNDTAALYNGFTLCKGNNGTSFRDDNIVSRAWDNVNYSYAYMMEFFPEMYQSNNELRKFLIDDLGICQDGITISDWKMKINDSYAFDMADLQKRRMVYKQKGATNTATVVGWEPIYADNQEGPRDSENFVRNFQRIRFDSDSDEQMLEGAREHVRLTPTLFDGIKSGQKHPYVFNTVSSASLLVDDQLVTTPLKAPLGRYSSLLDRVVKMNARNPEGNIVRTIGIDPKDVLDDFVTPASNHSFGINLDDYDTWVSTLPAIDSTDPYACGFCYIDSIESTVLNEFEKTYRNPENYVQGPKDVEDHVPVGEATPQSGGHTTSNPNDQNVPAFDLAADNRNLIQHIVNEGYLRKVKHALVFVGDGIWDHPFIRSAKYQSGIYAEQMRVDEAEDLSDSTGFSAVMQRVNTGKSEISEASVVDKDQWHSINFECLLLVCLGYAASQNDPSNGKDKIGGGKVNSAYNSLMAWLLANWDAVMLAGFEAVCYTYSPMYGDVAPAVYSIPAHLPLNCYADQISDDVLALDTARSVEKLGAPAAAATTSGDGFRPMTLSKQNMAAGVTAVGQYLLWFFDQMTCRMYAKSRFHITTGDDGILLSGFSGPAKKAFTFMNRGRIIHMGGKQPKTVAQLSAELKFDLDMADLNRTEIVLGKLVNRPSIRKNSVKAGSSLFSDRYREVKKVRGYMDYASSGSQASEPQKVQMESSAGDDVNPKKPNKGKGKPSKFDKPKKDAEMRDDGDKQSLDPKLEKPGDEGDKLKK